MKSRQSKPAAILQGKPEQKPSSPAKSSFPVVAIGASAGGLEAFKQFFSTLPTDTGMAFVLVQHLDPNHESMLTGILTKATKMPVEEVKAGVVIEPNRVYVIPPNTLMTVAHGVFQLSPRGKTPGHHMVVNHFMHSLASELGTGAIAIVLSGTGTDGTAGMEDIKAEGASPSRRTRPRLSTTECRAASLIPGAWTSFLRPKRWQRSCGASSIIPMSILKK